VSDHGVASTDPLGGKPLPPPSQVAARAAATSPAPPPRSKTPLVVAAAVVAVLVIAAVVVLVTPDSGGGATTLGDKSLIFTDDAKDETHPIVHTVKVGANQAVTIVVEADDDSFTPAIIDQGVVDAVNAQISDASDVLGNGLRDACANLREEDIGAKGSVAYFFQSADGAGQQTASLHRHARGG